MNPRYMLIFFSSVFFIICSGYTEKRVLVCGAGGLIGYHLVNRYKDEGYWVRGVDLKYPEFGFTEADEFIIGDLRNPAVARSAVTLPDGTFDEVCQLAANMGGMGFISAHDAEIMHDSSIITLNVLQACREIGAKKILYSSSACVYPEENQLDPLNPQCSEDSVYPAHPDTEYGWEKLWGERVCAAYARDYGLDIRVVRLHNVFGPYGTWQGGREKAPAALCRKVAMAKDGDTIDIWGKGDQTRSFLYIDECIEGLRRIMCCEKTPPIMNLGSDYMITINDLAALIAQIAGKRIIIRNIPGPEGVRGRNSDNRLIRKVLGWQPSTDLAKGISKLYAWIEEQVLCASVNASILSEK